MTTRHLIDAARPTRWCDTCDAATTHHVWSDGEVSCIPCLMVVRPSAQLPRDDGLGLGLHATYRPRWRPNWPAIYGWAMAGVAGCVWALAVVGVVRLVRP